MRSVEVAAASVTIAVSSNAPGPLGVPVSRPSAVIESQLNAEDFAVYEDGVQQPVSLFGSEHVPVDVALVLDTSSSMLALLPSVKQGARDLLGRLRDGDRASLIEIKRRIELRRSLAEDLSSVAAAIDAVEASGTTALYEGIYFSLREFERERRLRPELRRQALVLFSDGVDTTSHLDFDEVAERAREADVAIYTITPDYRYISPLEPGFDRRRSATWEMRTLTRDTGGLAFFAAKSEQLKPIYDTIAHDLVNQYAVGYLVPRPEDSRKFRRVSVRVIPPAKGVARTRAGYAATGDDAITVASGGSW